MSVHLLWFQIERLVFADFCAEIGVETIREYEQEYLKQQTELDKKQYDQHVSEKISRGQTEPMSLCLCAGWSLSRTALA